MPAILNLIYFDENNRNILCYVFQIICYLIFVGIHICNIVSSQVYFIDILISEIFKWAINQFIIKILHKKRAATSSSNPSFITTPYDNRMWSL
jgi:hypothetical protein